MFLVSASREFLAYGGIRRLANVFKVFGINLGYNKLGFIQEICHKLCSKTLMNPKTSVAEIPYDPLNLWPKTPYEPQPGGYLWLKT